MKHTNRKIYRQVYDFPIGPVVIEASETAITGIHMDHAKTDHVRNETDHKEIAIKAGKPKAFRAVGGACHRTPIFIMIPCHRVIGTDGSMTGYGGGIPVKKQLLSLEKA